MNILERLKYRLKGAKLEEVAAYETTLPHDIYCNVTRDGGNFVAHVTRIDDKNLEDGPLITEAPDYDALVSKVNDLVYTRVDMPEHIRPYYGDVFIPENPEQIHENMEDTENVVLKKS